MKVIRILTFCIITLLISMSTVHAQLLTVTLPKAGDLWKIGETKNIEWSYTGGLPDLQKWKIVLMKGSTVLGTIADNVSGSRYSWRVGQYTGGSASSGTDYKIQVSNVTFTQINSNSGVFSIAFRPPMTEVPTKLPPMEKKKMPTLEKALPVRVIYPNGGEKLEAGYRYTIQWRGTSVGRSGNVNVGLFRGSTEVDRLCTDVPNTGECAKTIDHDLSPKPVKARVWSASPIIFPADESDGDVMITNYRYLKILSPNGGETWKLGDPWQVRWETGGGWEGQVALGLVQRSTGKAIPLSFNPDGSLPIDTSDFIIQNTGSYTLVLPESYRDRAITAFTNYFQVPRSDFLVCISAIISVNPFVPVSIKCSSNPFTITR